jgi:hypothetical protein
MCRRPSLFVALATATLAAVAGAQETDVPKAPLLLELATVDYERGHWPEAFAAFATLADLGEAEAARIAVLMWRFGPALYRTEFSASPDQIQRWVRLAADAKVTASIASTRRGP